MAVGGRRHVAVGDAAVPLPQELKPALIGVAEDGELVVPKIRDLKDELPKGPGAGGAVDNLVEEAGPVKPVVVPHANDEDGGVLVRRRKGPDRQGDRHPEPEPEWAAAGR